MNTTYWMLLVLFLLQMPSNAAFSTRIMNYFEQNSHKIQTALYDNSIQAPLQEARLFLFRPAPSQRTIAKQILRSSGFKLIFVGCSAAFVGTFCHTALKHEIIYTRPQARISAQTLCNTIHNAGLKSIMIGSLICFPRTTSLLLAGKLVQSNCSSTHQTLPAQKKY